MRWTIGNLVLSAALAGACSTPADVPHVAPEREPPWVLGQRVDYDLQLHSGYGADGAPALFSLDLAATLELTPLRSDGYVDELQLRLRDVKLVGQQSGQALPDLKEIATAFEAASSFELIAGKFTQSHLPRDSHPLVVGVLRTLSATLQRVGATTSAGSWSARENDATGSYTATYRRLGPSSLERDKQRYETWGGTGQLTSALGAKPELPRILRSHMRVEGGERAPASIALEERLSVALGRDTNVLADTSLVLERRAVQTVVEDHASLHANTIALAADAPLPGTGNDQDLDRGKLAGVTFPQVLAGLEQQANVKEPSPAAGGDPRATERFAAEGTRLFTTLNASLRRTPGAVRDAGRAIRAGSPASEKLISGLGASGSEEGQALLLELMRDKHLSEQVRNACALSLVRTPKPSSVAVQGIEASLRDPDFGRLAIYGLGTFARLLRESGDKQESQRLVELLGKRFATAQSNAEKVDLILGLSNSGASAVLSLVRGGPLTDPSIEVRKAAVTALRLLTEPQAERLILDRLAHDEDRHVRLAALRALRAESASTQVTDALAAASLQDESDRVRYEAVRMMGAQLSRAPSLRDTLQRVASSDSQAAVRALAETALADAERKQGEQT